MSKGKKKLEIYGSDIRGGVLHEKGSLNGQKLPMCAVMRMLTPHTMSYMVVKCYISVIRVTLGQLWITSGHFMSCSWAVISSTGLFQSLGLQVGLRGMHAPNTSPRDSEAHAGSR